MRGKVVTVILLAGAALGHAPAIGPNLHENAADLERQGRWAEAAGVHLQAMNRAASDAQRRHSAGQVLADLASSLFPCADGAGEAAEFLEERARGDRENLSTVETLWMTFHRAACRHDTAAVASLAPAADPARWGELAEFWLAAGDLARELDRPQEAETAYREFLQARGGTGSRADVLVKIAGARLQANDIDTVAAILSQIEEETALDLSPRRDVLLLKSALAHRRGRGVEALRLLRVVIHIYPESPEYFPLVLEQARLAIEIGDRTSARGIVMALIHEGEGRVEADQARLLLASLVRNEGHTGAREARTLYRDIIQSADIELVARGLDRLTDAWLSADEPLRAFGMLAGYMEGEDRAIAALAARRFHLMLSHYLTIFLDRSEPVAAALLYRVAERTWQTATLTPAALMASSEAFVRLGLPDEAVKISAQAVGVARKEADRQATALQHGRLLFSTGKREAALQLLLSPVAGHCAAIALAIDLATDVPWPPPAVALLADRDLSGCDESIRTHATALLPPPPEQDTKNEIVEEAGETDDTASHKEEVEREASDAR